MNGPKSTLGLVSMYCPGNCLKELIMMTTTMTMIIIIIAIIIIIIKANVLVEI
jgi:hypothetical protein